jgi:hypothetical protein
VTDPSIGACASSQRRTRSIRSPLSIDWQSKGWLSWTISSQRSLTIWERRQNSRSDATRARPAPTASSQCFEPGPGEFAVIGRSVATKTGRVWPMAGPMEKSVVDLITSSGLRRL